MNQNSEYATPSGQVVYACTNPACRCIFDNNPGFCPLCSNTVPDANGGFFNRCGVNHVIKGYAPPQAKQ